MTNLRSLALGVGVLGLVALGAVPALSDGNAVIVTQMDVCYVLDGDGNIAWGSGVEVDVDADGSAITYTCHASGVANSTGHAVVWNHGNTGLYCIEIGDRDVWHNTVSESGEATLTCHFQY